MGLGNPGPRYERTRHNAGFLVVERILDAAGGRWIRRGSGTTLRDEAVIPLGSRELLLARPLTFMNRSGEPVADLLAGRGIDPASMLVVVDDTALPPGKLRLRATGGPGGHKGLRSIAEMLATAGEPRVPGIGEDPQPLRFGGHPRLRIGIGSPPPGIDLADYVLEPLSGDAWAALEAAVAQAVEAVDLACARGLEAAMDRFNPDPAPGA